MKSPGHAGGWESHGAPAVPAQVQAATGGESLGGCKPAPSPLCQDRGCLSTSPPGDLTEDMAMQHVPALGGLPSSLPGQLAYLDSTTMC